MARTSEPIGAEAQLSAAQLPFGAGEALPSAPGTPTPSTPPRRNRQSCFKRVESTEKLPSPRRFRRAPGLLEGGRSPPRSGPSSVHFLPLVAMGASSSSGGGREAAPSLLVEPAALELELGDEADSPMVDVEQMRSRADSDDKYWAQIKYAHQLLLDSTSTEMRLVEVADGNRHLLEPLFSDAIAGQEADRLSAVEMLRVLRQLVAEMDAEFAQRRAATASSARPEPDVGLRRSEREAPAREPDEDVASKKAKCSGPAAVVEAAGAAPATPPSAEPARSTPPLLGEPAPSTPPLSSGETAPSTPPLLGEPAPSTPPLLGEPAPSTPLLAAFAPAARAAVVDSLPLRTPQRRRSTGVQPERTPPAVARRSSKAKLAALPEEGSEKLRDAAA